MGTKAEDVYRDPPRQDEGPSQEASGEAAGRTNEPGEEVLPSEGRGKKCAAPRCNQFIC